MHIGNYNYPPNYFLILLPSFEHLNTTTIWKYWRRTGNISMLVCHIVQIGRRWRWRWWASGCKTAAEMDGQSQKSRWSLVVDVRSDCRLDWAFGKSSHANPHSEAFLSPSPPLTALAVGLSAVHFASVWLCSGFAYCRTRWTLVPVKVLKKKILFVL